MTSPHTLRQDAPILFSGAMVRAILEGRKTQTRRIIKPRGKAPSLFDGTWTDDYVLDPGNAEWRAKDVRFAPGMLLWVRERTMCVAVRDGEIKVRYEADGHEPDTWLPFPDRLKFKPIPGRRLSMGCYREASRITDDVTAVTVERLNDISEEDAKAEGADPILVPPDGGSAPHVEGFRDLWTSIHGPGSWEANPWVSAVSFKAFPLNIDQFTTRKENA